MSTIVDNRLEFVCQLLGIEKPRVTFLAQLYYFIFSLLTTLTKIPFSNNLSSCLTFLHLDLTVVPWPFNFILLLDVTLLNSKIVR